MDVAKIISRLSDLHPIQLVVPAAGVLQSALLLRYKPGCKSLKGAWDTRTEELWTSSTGDPKTLLWYRALTFVWALAVALAQYLDKGPGIFKFYTVWNWTLLTLYFGLAAWVSWAGVKGRAGRLVGRRGGGVNRLGYLMVALFHVVLTNAMIVDSLTWGLLWPMLKRTPDPVKVEFFRREFFCFMSYNQHGFNAVLVLGELALNAVPSYLYLLAWVGGVGVAFTVWASIHHTMSGLWIYPFLNPRLPNAALMQVLVFLCHWVFFFGVLGLFRLKGAGIRLLERRRAEARQRRGIRLQGTEAARGLNKQS